MVTDPVGLPSRRTPVYVFPTKETLGQKLSKFDPKLEFKKTGTVPSIWYYDPDIYEVEREAVFARNWVAVGQTGQVPVPRSYPWSYFTMDIAEEPVVILRGKDGTFKAFPNLCSHRATQLLTKAKGTLRDNSIQCDYHRFCFEASTGHLCSAPELGKVKGVFSIDELNRTPLEVDSWAPLVFLRMEKGKDSLSTTLAPLIERTADLDLSSLRWAGRKEYEINCNWKSYVSNFLDGGGHVPSIHPKLSESLNFEGYRTELFDRCSLQYCPTKETDKDTPSVRKGSAMYWWVYPNTMINIYKGVMDTNIVLPLGVDRCKVIFDFYFDKEWSQPSIKKYIDDSHKVQLEDMGVCERQRLKSRFFKSGPYGNREVGEHHFHQLLATDLQAIVNQ